MALKVKGHNKSNLPLIDYREVGILQGGLKEFAEQKDYDKLKASFKKYGFRFPFYLWFDLRDNTFKSIDGRGRLTVLTNEKAYIDTPGNYMIPYVEIEADNEQKAAELILLASSHYQTVVGFDTFKDDFGIEDDFLDEYTTFGIVSVEDEEKEIPDTEYSVNAHVAEIFTEVGDLYKFVNNKTGLTHYLICGDSNNDDTIAKICIGDVNEVFTDPPYGIDWDTDHSKMTPGLTGKVRENYPKIDGDKEPFEPDYWLANFDKHFFFGANCFSCDLPLGNWLVWDKRHKSGKSFLADAEVGWYNGSGAVHIVSYTKQGFIGLEGNSMHPTQKPVKLLALCMEKVNASKLLLDPYSGAGSTMLAADTTDRESRLVELLPYYCDVTVKRWLVYCRKNEIETSIFCNGEELTEEHIQAFLK
jgi:hypothetical protein